MRKFKSLFWRIFVAIWVANLLALIATATVIIHTLELEHFKDKHRSKIEHTASQIIQRIERHERRSKNKTLPKHFDHNGDLFKKIAKRHPMQIYLDGVIVYENKIHRLTPETSTEVKVNGLTGRAYTVKTLKAAPERFVVSAAKKINSVQFIFIFFFSAIVSWVLSWTITKPLKRLGHYSRKYAENQISASGNATLLNDTGLITRGDEIGALARDFCFMIQKVEENIGAQKQLLHDVSHELRAPLARLQAAAAILEKKMQEPDEYSARIHQECEQIDRLIQQILDFSRIDQTQVALEEVDLALLAEEQKNNLAIEHPDRHITIHSKNCMPVLAHYELLTRAVENILRNACKYSPAGSPIDITICDASTKPKLIIRDRGDGIKNEEALKLLTPFYRSGNKMHTDGFGLGLSITDRAMKKQGGHVSLNNHPEGGLEVTLHLSPNIPAENKATTSSLSDN